MEYVNRTITRMPAVIWAMIETEGRDRYPYDTLKCGAFQAGAERGWYGCLGETTVFSTAAGEAYRVGIAYGDGLRAAVLHPTGPSEFGRELFGLAADMMRLQAEQVRR